MISLQMGKMARRKSINTHIHIDLDNELRKLREDLEKMGQFVNKQTSHLIAAEKMRRIRLDDREIRELMKKMKEKGQI